VAEEFGISVEEAERIMTLFFSMFPQAAQWLLDQERQAHERGFVQNLFGRVRRLPEINSNDPALVAAAERQARNAPIQSAASDITNLALVRIDKAFSDVGMKARLLLQVHDEVLGEAPREEVLAAKEIVKQEMEAPVPGINVPLKAEVEVVERWGGEPIDVDKI
jgi:DNA polymerase-1